MKILQTDRLTLRWFNEEDAPFVLELLHSEGWQHFIGDRGVHSVDEARDWITHHLRAACERQGFGQWAIERRADGALVGLCGLVRRDKLPAIDVGYALLPRFEGAGYAREAAAATLAYSAEVLGLSTVLAVTRPDNERSIRLLRSLGLRLERCEPLAGDAHASMVFAWQHTPSAPAQLVQTPQGWYISFLTRKDLG